MNLSKVWAIYRNTLQNEVHSRSLLFLMLLTLGVVLLVGQLFNMVQTGDDSIAQIAIKDFENNISSVFMAGMGLWIFFCSPFFWE